MILCFNDLNVAENIKYSIFHLLSMCYLYAQEEGLQAVKSGKKTSFKFEPETTVGELRQ